MYLQKDIHGFSQNTPLGFQEYPLGESSARRFISIRQLEQNILTKAPTPKKAHIWGGSGVMDRIAPPRVKNHKLVRTNT